MGLLIDWFLKNTENNQVALDYSKLNSLFLSQNGLYRNKDGSIPTLEDFEQHGLSEDQYFLAVHGQTQSEIQNRLMSRNAAKRANRRNMINTRLAKNTKRNADSIQGDKKHKKTIKPNINEFSLFAPFGIYSLGVRDGQFTNIIEQSFNLTGTTFGLFEMMGIAGFGNDGSMDSSMNDFIDSMNQEALNTHLNDTFDSDQNFNSNFDNSSF